jgi:microcystin-dependent protein
MDKIQKVVLNLSSKVDITNPKTITLLISAIIIIFAIIYVYQSRKTVEGFASYTVTGANDTVLLGDLNKVRVGTTNTNLMDAITSDSAFYTDVKKIIDENNSNFVTNDNLQANISSLPQFNDINSLISNSVAGFARQVDVSRQITSAVQNLASINYVNGQLSAISTPAFTIIAIFDNQIPIGWQLCDGAPLRVSDNITPFLRNNQVVNTPDLRGRTIIGTGQGTNMTNRTLGAIGGSETHKLTLTEMPVHYHPINVARSTNEGCTADRVAPVGEGAGITTGCAWAFNNEPNRFYDYNNRKFIGYTGGDPSLPQIQDPQFPTDLTKKINDTAPHNNMQPFVALTYIIKQPVSNSVTTTTPTTTRIA